MRLGHTSARGANGTEKMPDGVFNILRIDRLVTLKLRLPFFILFRIIIRQTPLPMMRILLWNEGNEGIEVGNRLGDFGVEKVLFPSSLQRGETHPHPTALRSDGGRVSNDLVVVPRLKRVHDLLRHLGSEVTFLSIGTGTQKKTECEE